MNKVEVSNLNFSYSYKDEILKNVNFGIKNNESVGIIGANGVGKSTLLKLLVGLMPAYEGFIKINDLSVERRNLRDIRRSIGYVFQDSDCQLFMTTVYDDVAFALRNYGFSEEVVDSCTTRALKEVNMEKMSKKQIYRLSGGEKKLVSIATVLSMEPEIIILDEPSVGLDPKNRRNLINTINNIEVLKIIASHDLDFIYDTCSRIILLTDGRIVYDGDAKKILKDRTILEKNGMELPLSFSK
jgi:cobalt/nickel transport system ATP-binding protein